MCLHYVVMSIHLIKNSLIVLLSTYVMMIAFTYTHDHVLFYNKTFLDHDDCNDS